MPLLPLTSRVLQTIPLNNPTNFKRQLKKLSEDSLTKQPEEVFDVLEKLGEGSYGCVFKANHKETGEIVAIKQVPVESDLQEILKEITIMQQCNSPHVVRYYGSYFKNRDLWIVMEYCGGGSVSDIVRIRNKTDTMAKRNTVIGTPFWMAPEVIQEIGYNCVADIWSLGITAIEMAEGKPPYADIHPMRAIFMIPTNPPPTFRNPDQWSPGFLDFIKKCLVKNPENRATATQLLQHPFIKSAKPNSVLRALIQDAMEIKLKRQEEAEQREQDAEDDNNSDEDEVDQGTMVRAGTGDSGTIRAAGSLGGSLSGTMIEHEDTGTMQSQLGTMVINSDDEEEAGTMKRRDETMQPAKPSFLEYFEQKEKEVNNHIDGGRRGENNADNRKLPGEGDLEVVGTWSVEELRVRLASLDPQMEQEIEEIRQRYQAKRQPILDAISAKKRLQQNF
uniref:non-specific serine/threonine protein kinase n=1 Tax=Poecilia mexicana TaxID=48701 RepID=A0A3B3X717_9TELE